jgi:hypothetical protein
MNRTCGSCSLCCRLLPVKGVNKPANTRCKFQRHSGCQVYHKPEKGFPWECGLWNCIWLQGEDTGDLRRPDRSGYVIDVMPDFVTAQDPKLGKIKIPAVQIWVDPKFPDAHRDPALRAWLIRRTGFVGLVRVKNDGSDLVLIPPYMMDTGEWLEKTHGNVQEGNHSFAQVLEVLGGA